MDGEGGGGRIGHVARVVARAGDAQAAVGKREAKELLHLGLAEPGRHERRKGRDDAVVRRGRRVPVAKDDRAVSVEGELGRLRREEVHWHEPAALLEAEHDVLGAGRMVDRRSVRGRVGGGRRTRGSGRRLGRSAGGTARGKRHQGDDGPDAGAASASRASGGRRNGTGRIVVVHGPPDAVAFMRVPERLPGGLQDVRDGRAPGLCAGLSSGPGSIWGGPLAPAGRARAHTDTPASGP